MTLRPTATDRVGRVLITAGLFAVLAGGLMNTPETALRLCPVHFWRVQQERLETDRALIRRLTAEEEALREEARMGLDAHPPPAEAARLRLAVNQADGLIQRYNEWREEHERMGQRLAWWRQSAAAGAAP